MHLLVAGIFSLYVVLWHWCNGQISPEDLQKYIINPPNMVGPESPINKTIDQLIVEAMRGLNAVSSSNTVDGGILMELDMLLSEKQYYSLYEQPNSSAPIRGKRKAIRTPWLRWTNGIMPYRFEPKHFSKRDKYMIRQAMTEWERYTCLRFRAANGSDTNFIVFQDAKGCYSQLGMVGGQQVVALSSAGCRYTGIYLHEIGHSIGLVHEHQRPNRDDYIEIIRENVQPGLLDQFTKYSAQAVDQMNVGYEYSSVMHYGVTAYSKDGVSNTIRVKYPGTEASIGQVYMKELSFTDVEIVNKMYRCHAKCDSSIKCSDGYVDENCRCVCKDGSNDCQIGGGKQPVGSTCGVNTHDSNWQCFVWAQQGQCEANTAFMSKACARACGPCGLKREPGKCVDMYPKNKCRKWSNNGDCMSNTIWMKNYCCGTCEKHNNKPTCQNKHLDSDKCELWASEGKCMSNPQWMIQNCQKSCSACSMPQTTPGLTTTPALDNETKEEKNPGDPPEVTKTLFFVMGAGTSVLVVVTVMALVIGIRRKRSGARKQLQEGNISKENEASGYDVVGEEVPTGNNNVIVSMYDLRSDREYDYAYQALPAISAANRDIDSRSEVGRLVLQTASNNATSGEYASPMCSPRSSKAEVNSYLEPEDLTTESREKVTVRSQVGRVIAEFADNNAFSNGHETSRSSDAEVHSYLEPQGLRAGHREESTARYEVGRLSLQTTSNNVTSDESDGYESLRNSKVEIHSYLKL